MIKEEKQEPLTKEDILMYVCNIKNLLNTHISGKKYDDSWVRGLNVSSKERVQCLKDAVLSCTELERNLEQELSCEFNFRKS